MHHLRDLAGLGQAELAARAHYPRDVIREAEAGPSLPDLPVLSAYVRGCGGTAAEIEDWEERWRKAVGAPASPLLQARSAGVSDAASAGARAGADARAGAADIGAQGSAQGGAAIMAALDRFAEKMATSSSVAPEASPGLAGPAGVPPSRPAGAQFSPAGAASHDARMDTPTSSIADQRLADRPLAGRSVTGLPAQKQAVALVAVVICVLIVLLAIFA
jgi:hypothetical protein